MSKFFNQEPTNENPNEKKEKNKISFFRDRNPDKKKVFMEDFTRAIEVINENGLLKDEFGLPIKLNEDNFLVYVIQKAMNNPQLLSKIVDKIYPEVKDPEVSKTLNIYITKNAMNKYGNKAVEEDENGIINIG